MLLLILIECKLVLLLLTGVLLLDLARHGRQNMLLVSQLLVLVLPTGSVIHLLQLLLDLLLDNILRLTDKSLVFLLTG